MSGVARIPSSSPSAVMMMVLPAPVSPDRTFRPGANSSTACSIIAKLRIRSSSSIAVRPASSPVQLVAPDLEIGVGRSDQGYRAVALVDDDSVGGAQRACFLAVD